MTVEPSYWAFDLVKVVIPKLNKIYSIYEVGVVSTIRDLINTTPFRIEKNGEEKPSDPEFADWEMVAERIERVILDEQLALVDTHLTFTNAACEALYVEASRYLLTLYRKELLTSVEEQQEPLPKQLGKLYTLYLCKGIDLTQLTGFEAYDLLRLIANCHKHAHGNSCDELRKRRPEWVQDALIGVDVRLMASSEVRKLLDGLISFLAAVVPAVEARGQHR